jgi:nondiscriminating glutamyl-tRNA synthetase
MAEEAFKLKMSGSIRVRLAPSPTGFLHIGTARAALFNYLFAKKHKGVFIIRIEDTDPTRSKPEYEKDILDNLRWLGLEWNEGPEVGGDYGPYRQSEKLDVYAGYLKKLITENKAYYCFCSKEELEAQKQYQISVGESPRYLGECRGISQKEAEERLARGEEAVIRFKVPHKRVNWEDVIRGNIEFDASLLGDIVIAVNLHNPLYNFAVVIDDYEMKISHVVRGEDHVSNTPKQILIREALGFPGLEFAHMPLILGPDRSKLSKRHGAVSILQYKKEGYLPEALVNFMAFLGWNPGTEREIYSLPSLVKDFSMDRVQKGGAVFNIKRLDYLNGFYIRQKSADKLTQLCLPYLIEAGFIEKVTNNPSNPETKKLFKAKYEGNYIVKETGGKISFENIKDIVAIYQERLKKLSEISELTDFFFKEKLDYEKDLLRWGEMTDREIRLSLERSKKILSRVRDEDLTRAKLESVLLKEAEVFSGKLRRGANRGHLLWPLRVALTGKKSSAGPFEVAEILGREKVLQRIKEARRKLK